MGATIHRYSNAGKSLGVLTTENAVHEEDLDGSDSLSLVSRTRPDKRERLVWQDNAGVWHEHIVDSTTDDHSGHDRVRIECLNSIVELAGVEASGDKAKKSVHAHLTDLLAGTRWTVGTCSNFGAVELETFHKNVRECISDLLSLTSGELVTTITVSASGVANRSIGIVEKRGSKTVTRAFTYKHNMAGVRREVGSDEVYTAVIGYGAKVSQTYLENKVDSLTTEYNSIQAQISELEAIADRTQEQEDELTQLKNDRTAKQNEISAVNKKLAKVRKNEYAERLRVVVTSDLPLSRWGVPKGDGTFGHSYYIYTDSNCNDPAYLKRECKDIANAVCRPVVHYRFDIAEVDSDMWTDVRLGNRVLCIDEDLGDVPNDPNAGTRKRISHIRRQLAGRMSCVIEIGERTSPLLDQFVAAERISRAATGNKTRVAAKKQIPTNGNYPSGDTEWYDPDYIGPYPEGPAAISIIVPPDKTSYYEGEKIDYTGIQVQLLDGEGEVYTSGDYPDGMVPFGELAFPVEVCPADSSSVYEADGGIKWSANADCIVSTANQFLCQTADPRNPDTLTNFRKTRDGAAICVAVKNVFSYLYMNDDWDSANLVSFDKFATGIGSFYKDGNPHIAESIGGPVSTSESQTAADIMDAANVSIYMSSGAGFRGQDITTSTVPILDLNNERLSNGAILERILSFAGFSYTTDGSDPAHSGTIPVRFGELEATFEITILGKREASEDEYPGSGGGKWDDEDEPFWPYGNPMDDIPELY